MSVFPLSLVLLSSFYGHSPEPSQVGHVVVLTQKNSGGAVSGLTVPLP